MERRSRGGARDDFDPDGFILTGSQFAQGILQFLIVFLIIIYRHGDQLGLKIPDIF